MTGNSLDKRIFKAVAAMSCNGVIGNKGQLPWHLSEDLKFFKKLTYGSPVIMGRKTYESIGRPLPGRKNIVISSNSNIQGNIENHQSIEELIDVYKDSTESLFIIGGSQIYSALLNWTKEIYLTYIYKEYSGDTYFPQIDNDFILNSIEFKTEEFEVRKMIRKPVVA
jgi:dihydrofolate reductase